MSSSNNPSEKRIDKWKKLNFWLQFLDEGKMVCSICSSQKDRICSMPNFNSNFILGSTNFQASTLKDHDVGRCHNQAVREKEHEEAFAAGRSLLSKKVKQNVHSNSSIVHGIQLMGGLERDTARNCQSYCCRRKPFSNFKVQLEIEQMHGVKYSGAYENDKACTNVIFDITEYFF